MRFCVVYVAPSNMSNMLSSSFAFFDSAVCGVFPSCISYPRNMERFHLAHLAHLACRGMCYDPCAIIHVPSSMCRDPCAIMRHHVPSCAIIHVSRVLCRAPCALYPSNMVRFGFRVAALFLGTMMIVASFVEVGNAHDHHDD